jgi:hypothetical protein
MTKQELIQQGKTVLADNPDLEMVLVTADGQVFEPGKRWAAESHARQHGLTPELLMVKAFMEPETVKKQTKKPDHS